MIKRSPVGEADILRHIEGYRRAQTRLQNQPRGDSLDSIIISFAKNRIAYQEFQKRILALGFDMSVVYSILRNLLNAAGSRMNPATNGQPHVNGQGEMWVKFGWVRKATSPHQELYVGQYRTRFGSFYGEIVVEQPLNRAGATTYRIYIKDPPPALKNHPQNVCFFDKGSGLYFVNVIGAPPQSVNHCIGYVITEIDKCHTIYKG